MSPRKRIRIRILLDSTTKDFIEKEIWEDEIEQYRKTLIPITMTSTVSDFIEVDAPASANNESDEIGKLKARIAELESGQPIVPELTQDTSNIDPVTARLQTQMESPEVKKTDKISDELEPTVNSLQCEICNYLASDEEDMINHVLKSKHGELEKTEEVKKVKG